MWLAAAVLLSFLLFFVLYQNEKIEVEEPKSGQMEAKKLEEWTLDSSVQNGTPISEDKSIYPEEPDNSIHDVYVSVFPTKDKDGKVLKFADFSKHTARDHAYNPVLKCNIQILEEDKKPDPLTDTDAANATIRVRGNSSRGDTYKSYKVKMDDDAAAFEGQNILNLNKHSEDDIKVTTKLCTDVLAKMDHMVSFRTNFMRVWIRDTSLPEEEQSYTYYGLFTNTEQPNKSFLELRGLSSNGEMYKARDFSFAVNEKLREKSDPEYSVDEFEEVLTIREADSHTQLLEMIDAVNDYSIDFEKTFGTYFNEENYLTWLAFNLLVGGEDILNHNFIIYRPENTKTWYFIPWDFDSNLQKESSTLAASLRGGQRLNMVVLHKRYFRMPGSLEKIQNKMSELMTNYFNADAINHIMNGYIPVLEKTIPYLPDLDLISKTPADMLQHVREVPDIIQRHYQEFQAAFECPAPMYVSAPTRKEGGGLQLSWEPSYSYQGRTMTYQVRIYNDYGLSQLLFEQKDIIENTCDVNLNLDPGTYYLEVKAIDSEGNEQYSLEHFEFAGELFVYVNGLLEFTLN